MRRARPASGGAPDTAAVSQIPARYLGYQPGISDTSPVSRRLRRSPSRTRRLSPPPLTAHYCSALRRTRRARGARRTWRHAAQSSAGTQDREWRNVGAWPRRCRSSASMLCSRYSLRSCRSTTSTVAVRERSYTTHDTAPVSQILSQYPGILRRYPRYQSGIPAVLCPSDPVALATSHTTYCCYPQITEGGGLSSTVSSVSRSGTR